jgi:hypothetical protein
MGPKEGSPMQITLELPADIAQGLGSTWNDLPRAALESLALEAYRSHALTAAQLRRLLGFETRMQVDAFLKEHEIYDYTAADFEQDPGNSPPAPDDGGSALNLLYSWSSSRTPRRSTVLCPAVHARSHSARCIR